MKITKYLIIILFIFAFKLNVEATSLGVSISCPSTAYTGDTINCSVSANASDGTINGINANYNIENATFNSFSPADGWSTYNNSTNGFAIGNLNGISGSSLIGNISIHVDGAAGSSVKVGLNNIGASDTDYNDVSASNVSKTISIIEKPIPTTTTRKKIVTLNDLSIEGYDINFNKHVFNYTIDVGYEVNLLKVNAISDNNNKITGTGTININEGENTLLVVVTNLENESTTYTIKVNRVVKVSNVVSNNIEEINNAYKSNKELIVNLKSESDELKVHEDVIDTIKNTDRKITYNILKDEEVLYYYEFDGEKFTETYNDIDLKINFIEDDKKIDNSLKDDNKLVFENDHKGYFPTGTVLNIKNTTGIKENNTIKLYKVNVEDNIELITNNVILRKKYLSFNIEKGAKYVISNKKYYSHNPALTLFELIMLILNILVFIGLGLGFVYFKKHKKILDNSSI